jgi:Xaa-Pro aminopeptidase
MVRYFTDIQMSSYGGAVIFPLDGDMTLITSGAPNVEPKIDPVVYNAQCFSRPFIPSMNYARDQFPAIAVEVFKKSKSKTVGIVEKSLFPLSFYEYMKEKLTNVKFVDATDMVEDIRSVKSEEEISLMQKTAAMQDKVMLAVQSMIRPGVREYEIWLKLRECAWNWAVKNS